jgi:GDP-4-dehydro-6-deoxy-D-mannose reductase
MKVAITGASGFIGTHLIERLSPDVNYQVYGLYFKNKPREMSNVTFIPCDVTCEAQVHNFFATVKPDTVFHLAGRTHGSLSDLLDTNVVGTRNVLEAIRLYSPASHVLVMSSSAVYGYAGTKPIRESTCFCPVGNYGISKASAEMIVQQYISMHSLEITVVRSFNIIGPGQSTQFLVGTIVDQIACIMEKKQECIFLRSLSSSRDYIDVRDVVNALTSFMRRKSMGTYNIGSGKAWSTQEIVDLLFDSIGESFPILIPDPTEQETIPIQISDNSSIMKDIGWNPMIDIKSSLQDMLNKRRGLHV